jgi:toxin ParE1/3/4
MQSIRLYGLSHWGMSQTDAYLARLANGLSRLTDHPQIGKRRDDLALGVRTWLVGRHVIYYQAAADQISIIRILHERVDPSQHAFG